MEGKLATLEEDILKQLIERSEEFKIDLLRVDEHEFQRKIDLAIKTILRTNKITLNHREHEVLHGEIISCLLGLGPLDKLLKDQDITEIMVNGPKQVYIERNGNVEPVDTTFKDNEHLMYFIDKIISPQGRRLTELEPYVDARLSDGSRVNIVRSPVSSIGPILTIRKYSHRVLALEDLVKLGTLDYPVAEFLKACVTSSMNLLICGGAGSGKTTLLNALVSLVPDKERIITIEDTRELQINRKHWVPMETRPANIEGSGEIDIRDLLRNALHMRPDRIIVGEVRSSEVLDMIQAMNTGHEGSMTTLHANSPLDALDRLEVLSLMSGVNISSEVAMRQIISALDLIIHIERLPGGSRKIMRISELIKAKEYILEDIFVLAEDNSGEEKLRFTGKTPKLYQKLKKKANYITAEFEQGN